jgi:hypothetical protein
MKIVRLMLLLVLIESCSTKEPVITIVDIGRNNRLGIGKELRIVRKHSPKLIGLDFYLDNDSSAIDSILVKELNESNNVVMVEGLHRYLEEANTWDSLEVSNQKFNCKEQGFTNLYSNDSVFTKTLSMNQLWRGELIPAFSCVVAKNTYGIKEKYRNKGLLNELDIDISGIGKNYRIITNKDLLSGNFKGDDLTGKIVLMGYIGGKEDVYYINKSKTRKLNGVEIHAELINELIDRN